MIPIVISTNTQPTSLSHREIDRSLLGAIVLLVESTSVSETPCEGLIFESKQELRNQKHQHAETSGGWNDVLSGKTFVVGKISGKYLTPRGLDFYGKFPLVFEALGVKLTAEGQNTLNLLLAGRCTQRDINFGKAEMGPWFALNILCAMLETLFDFDPRLEEHLVPAEVLSFVSSFKGLDSKDAVKRLKFMLSYWFAYYIGDELPQGDPSWDPWPFSGYMRKHFRRMAHYKDKKGQPLAKMARLFYSLLQCKRGCVPVPESYIEKCLLDHRALLTRELIDGPSNKVDSKLTRELIDEITVRTDVILNKFTVPFELKAYEPSTSSCYETGSGVGGQFTRMMLDFKRGYFDELLGAVQVGCDRVEWKYGWALPRFEEMVHDIYLRDLPLGRMTCNVCPVLEPLKVRNVTCGRAGPYFITHCIQKWMHANLRRLPQFELIGKPVDEDVIGQFLSKSLGPLVVSGDYSAATDNLKMEVTKTIFERMLRRIELQLGDGLVLDDSSTLTELLELARKVLYEHILEYPPDYPEVHSAVQSNGQLMGSPLSFPILCIANLICYWMALYPDKSFEELVVLVNGDDILFTATDSEYKVWSDYLPTFGFVKSIGKNYAHPRFFMIDSELFDRQAFSRPKPGLLKTLPYFPSGLLMGRSKVARHEEELEAPVSLASLELVLRGAFNPTRALERYMRYHSKDVHTITSGKLNIFLPVEKGGFGIKSYGAQTYSVRDKRYVPCDEFVTDWQLKYASYLSNQRVLKTSHLRKEERTPPWNVVYRVQIPGMRHLDTQESLDNASDEDCERYEEYLNAKTKERNKSLLRYGPPGWSWPKPPTMLWHTCLSGSVMRTIEKCKPMSLTQLSEESFFYYSDFKPNENDPRQNLEYRFHENNIITESIHQAIHSQRLCIRH